MSEISRAVSEDRMDYNTMMKHAEKSGVLAMKKTIFTGGGGFSAQPMRAVLFDFQLFLYRQKESASPKKVVPLKEAEIKGDRNKDKKFGILCATHKNASYEVQHNCFPEYYSPSVHNSCSFSLKPRAGRIEMLGTLHIFHW